MDGGAKPKMVSLATDACMKILDGLLYSIHIGYFSYVRRPAFCSAFDMRPFKR